MKNKFMTLVFVFLACTSFATHYLASDISYTHLSGLTYGITIRIYNNTYNTTADRCEITIHFGDGDTLIVPRVNGGTSLCPPAHDGIMIATNVKESIYYTTHTYPGPGTYFVSFEDVNRTADICNIPNSINTGIFMLAEIVINPFLGINTSPQYTSFPLNTVGLSSINYYNPSVTESEADSLYYQLIPPAGNNITGFTFPPASNSFSIDSSTGTVTWDKPTMICTYSYDIRIKEYRSVSGTRYYIGSTMQDIYTIVSASAEIENFNTEETLSVYPNPCNRILTINGNAYTDFTIWDIYGRIVNLSELYIKTKYSSDNKIAIDISSLSNGIYFVNLKTEQGMVSKKVIINK